MSPVRIFIQHQIRPVGAGDIDTFPVHAGRIRAERGGPTRDWYAHAPIAQDGAHDMSVTQIGIGEESVEVRDRAKPGDTSALQERTDESDELAQVERLAQEHAILDAQLMQVERGASGEKQDACAARALIGAQPAIHLGAT